MEDNEKTDSDDKAIPYLAKMSKVEGGDRVRTETVVGKCFAPEVGERFDLINNEPVQDKIETILGEVEASHRYVTTSPVQEVEELENGLGWTIETWSGSIYTITIMERL